MIGDERDGPVVLSAEQCAEIASALADDDARKAEVMLYAAQYPREELGTGEGFTEQERQWAARVRSLHQTPDLNLDAAVGRLDAAIRTETADLLAGADSGDEQAANAVRLLSVHVLEQVCAMAEQADLPLEGLGLAVVGARARAEALAEGDLASQTGPWRAVVDELRELADVLGQASVNLYNHVAWVERQDWTQPPPSAQAQLSSGPPPEAPQVSEPPAATDDVAAMLRRIDRAVDADVAALYERKDAGDDSVRPVLRQRAFHLLELGICEAGEAGIDTTGVETAVEAAFELPGR